MILTGEVTNVELRQLDPDDDRKTLMLQVQISDPNDIQEAELMRHGGVDYNPVSTSQVAILTISEGFKVAVACDDGIESEADPGDYEIYGNDGTGKTSRVKCVSDGQVELNGTGDFAVRYNELETAFNELKTDFNGLVTRFNTHKHGGVIVAVSGGTVGNSGGPDSTDTITQADISPAKIAEVEVSSGS